jgi:hypothetical protein
MLDLRFAIVVPARRVPRLGRNVLERDGEVDVVQVEVVDAPVGELLLDNGLDLFRVVERVPQLGDDEEVFAFYEPLLDGASDTFSALNLVAVVCGSRRVSRGARSEIGASIPKCRGGKSTGCSGLHADFIASRDCVQMRRRPAVAID